METKHLVISFAILYVVTGVAIGIFNFFITFIIRWKTDFIKFWAEGVGLYYAGYNADHSSDLPPAPSPTPSPAPKPDVFQPLQDEISADSISDYLKYK